MSKKIIDLPPSPLRSTAAEGDLLHAPVVATLMNGKSIRGLLASLDGPREVLTLHCREKTRAVIRFSQLRHLDFLNRHPVNRDTHPLEQRGEVDMPAASQGFRVLFIDGRTLTGRTRGSFVNDVGLHFFQLVGNSHITRLFIPSGVVKKYYLGPAADKSTVIPAAPRPRTNPKKKAPAETPGKAGARARKRRKTDRAPEDNTAVTTKELEELLDLQAMQTGRSQRLIASKRIGEMMVEDHLITPQQLVTALKAQREDHSKKIGQILVEQGLLSALDLYSALAHKFGLPFVKLRNFDIDMETLTLVPTEVARKYNLIPLFTYKNRLVVAMDDPTDSDAINMLRFITHHNVELTISMREDIEWAINKYYGLLETAEAAEELQDGKNQTTAQQEQSQQEIERLAKEKPIVRFVNNSIIDAIQREASDIHIRPLDDFVDLLFRIDGALVHVRRFSKVLLPAVVSRIKIMGNMDIAERRLPQDGRTSMINGNSTVDLRISVMPTIEGESVVIRILNTSAGLKPIEELGFSTRDQQVFVDMLHKSYGMILVTGPTGSGKSTTLYAALNEVRTRNVNILTVEDPVEYHIAGIEQIQVNNATGYSFAKALRHILRHDPDVIMLGEIRDEETGKIAVESSLTGHLVLSTLHTNDAASAMTRLLEMGVEPYLLSATLLGTLAQRLVRRNCIHCTEEEPIDPATREALGVSFDEVFYRGAGCEHCNNTGYHGRLAVYELLKITPDVHSLIMSGAAASDIHIQAVADGMVPLTENALIQARLRKTSLAEVYRIRLK